ncbi:MarR family transcriptional regulator [Clostridium sp. D2Q-14]|uniref:MarR family winged helix-turn-helix transcriptional regulator n=1 Tax=Anaeromonas gelatinilytica TaxID=2683194 RepID=UPI00193B7419|nr:MarR family transcriptional regulator [Anaeromonas gelatinilytica]
MYEEKHDLMGLFSHLQWLLHRHYHQHRMVCGPMGNPHRGQGRVLSLLKIQPEITQKELTYLLDMRPQSLGELLARLEQNGYITCTTSEKDRRSIDIKLKFIPFTIAFITK